MAHPVYARGSHFQHPHLLLTFGSWFVYRLWSVQLHKLWFPAPCTTNTCYIQSNMGLDLGQWGQAGRRVPINRIEFWEGENRKGEERLWIMQSSVQSVTCWMRWGMVSCLKSDWYPKLHGLTGRLLNVTAPIVKVFCTHDIGDTEVSG
jgi:hypothetical protein